MQQFFSKCLAKAVKKTSDLLHRIQQFLKAGQWNWMGIQWMKHVQSSLNNYYETDSPVKMWNWLARKKQLASCFWRQKYLHQCFNFLSFQILRKSPILLVCLLVSGGFWNWKVSKHSNTPLSSLKSFLLSVIFLPAWDGIVESTPYC